MDMNEKEIRKILKEETVIPDNIDKAMEDVLNRILDSPDERIGNTNNLVIKPDKRRKKSSGNKKKIIRILLPVAAVLGISTGVLATKLGWLHKELEQQGVTGQETAQMIVTEPDSNAENVEDMTSYHITPEEMDWRQSMLSITEAYFDGSSLSFLGEPSNEARNYMISCRDHATVNGEDALASLNKIDGENLYYGHITLYDDALTEKILKEDSKVELSMTIQAYPDYNGKIYYTWKDYKVYEKIFKTGSFTDSEGMLSYALPAEDVYRGYTPQTLTLTLPLNDEVRDIIEKYRKEGKLQAEDTGVEPTSDSLDESTQETTGLENSLDSTEVNEKHESETTVLQVNENHVIASLQGKSGMLTIDADIIGSTFDVSKGILEKCNISEKEICSWFGGKDGWEKAQEIQPELVITDLIIPEMSGKELCYKIKNNIELAQVSVILITAQMSTEQMIEAFRFGADDYIIKPFDIRMLLARCRNLLKNKSRLKAYYTNKAIPETSAEDAISESDRKLLQKCIDIIRENFTNPDFDVASLANALCMGRSKLYTKFKQLVGLPPNEFILKIKLEEAMSLLKEHPELNISEVSMQVGFSSPRYFSKLFKNFFGITPQSVRGKGERTDSI